MVCNLSKLNIIRLKRLSELRTNLGFFNEQFVLAYLQKISNLPISRMLVIGNWLQKVICLGGKYSHAVKVSKRPLFCLLSIFSSPNLHFKLLRAIQFDSSEVDKKALWKPLCPFHISVITTSNDNQKLLARQRQKTNRHCTKLIVNLQQKGLKLNSITTIRWLVIHVRIFGGVPKLQGNYS